MWTTILQVEKNCEFENVTPAELIASKVLSVIGRSTGDYELKKKIRRSDMTIETITASIHEHMYDRLNESNNSNDGKKIKHVQERPHKRKWTDKTDQDKLKRQKENQKYKQRDNRERKMQYTGARRKRVKQHTDLNDSRTRLGEHKHQPSVRQRTKEVNQRQKEHTNTWSNNQCKTNNRRRSKRNHSGRSKR